MGRFQYMLGQIAVIHDIKDEVRQHEKNAKFIRIGGNSCTAISLDNHHPLYGYAHNKKVEKLLDNLESGSADSPSGEKLDPKRKVEEKRLQARILRQAVGADAHQYRELKDILNVADEYESLLFCFDEISLGDAKKPVPLANPVTKGNPKETKGKGIVRCDILAVGKKDGLWRPVLIELKYTRAMTRLKEQLDNFISIFNGKNIAGSPVIPKSEKLQYALKALICALLPDIDPHAYEHKFEKMIVWPIPASKSFKRTTALNEPGAIDVITEVFYDSDYVDGETPKPVDSWKIGKREYFEALWTS